MPKYNKVRGNLKKRQPPPIFSISSVFPSPLNSLTIDFFFQSYKIYFRLMLRMPMVFCPPGFRPCFCVQLCRKINQFNLGVLTFNLERKKI
jgi:hypothetical protein